MDASSSKTNGSSQLDITDLLRAAHPALMANVPEGYLVMMNVVPLLPMKTASLSTQNRTLLLMRLAAILGMPFSISPDLNATCVENLPLQQESSE